MARPLIPCIVCGAPTKGSYCKIHDPRDHGDEALRRAILKQHRATRGEWCDGMPELGHDPHPSTDLTVDHIERRRWGGHATAANTRVVCREWNSRRH